MCATSRDGGYRSGKLSGIPYNPTGFRVIVGHDVGLNLFIFFYRKLMTTRNAARKTPS
jgi:hypothetical protein